MKNKYDLGILSYNINTLFSNYGAALHSFAFQKYLDKLNINSVIVDYAIESHFKQMWNIYKRKPFKYHKLVLYATIKYFMVKRFFKKNCTVTKKKYNNKTIKNIDCANRYCCETDVTWSTSGDDYNHAFMCEYPNMKNKNNIAYSIDFGSKEIPDSKKELLKYYAKNFKNISIRNIFRLNEFKNIIDRDDISVTIDPVFLIEEDEWNNITKSLPNKKDYVLVYNCKEDNNRMVEQAKKFAKEKNLTIKIINCCNKDIENKNAFYPTPISIEHFLGAIKNCSYFFTNSYHGICFAIIFEKEFYAYQRDTNNQKILTITSLFNLENRIINDTNLDLPTINYNDVKEILKKRKKESQDWLKEALNTK